MEKKQKQKKKALLALTSHPASHPPPPLSQQGKSCAKYLLNLHFITEVILGPIFYSESWVYLFPELFAAQ